jgi:hypothetical protein
VIPDLTLFECQCLDYGLSRTRFFGLDEDVGAWRVEYGHHYASGVENSLLAKGLLEPIFPEGAIFRDKLRLSQRGADVARTLRRMRAETWRIPAVARTMLLRALYQVATAPEGESYDGSDLWRVKPRRDRDGTAWVLLSDLHGRGRLHVHGKQLTAAEIEHTTQGLNGDGLVEFRQDENSPSGWACATPDGMDCAESGEPVDEYLQKRRNGAASTFITHVSGSHGVIIGQQENFTQVNEQGFDPSKVIEFAGLVRQISPTLGLAAEQETGLARQAAELEAEATAGGPDRGRLRRLASSLLNGLASAAPTVAGQMAIGLGEEALKALGD